jgi:hypothetical protein
MLIWLTFVKHYLGDYKMKKLIAFIACLLVGCGTADSVTSFSNQETNTDSKLDYVFPCEVEDDHSLCRDSGLTGVCFRDICVACDGWPFRSIKEGYPMDKGACYSIVCDVPSPNKGLAYWRVQTQPVGKVCSTEGVSGHCVNDGRCCEPPDYSTNPPTIKCSTLPTK